MGSLAGMKAATQLPVYITLLITIALAINHYDWLAQNRK